MNEDIFKKEKVILTPTEEIGMLTNQIKTLQYQSNEQLSTIQELKEIIEKIQKDPDYWKEKWIKLADKMLHTEGGW